MTTRLDEIRERRGRVVQQMAERSGQTWMFPARRYRDDVGYLLELLEPHTKYVPDDECGLGSIEHAVRLQEACFCFQHGLLWRPRCQDCNDACRHLFGISLEEWSKSRETPLTIVQKVCAALECSPEQVVERVGKLCRVYPASEPPDTERPVLVLTGYTSPGAAETWFVDRFQHGSWKDYDVRFWRECTPGVQEQAQR